MRHSLRLCGVSSSVLLLLLEFLLSISSMAFVVLSSSSSSSSRSNNTSRRFLAPRSSNHVGVMSSPSCHYRTSYVVSSSRLFVSSGFSFSDGDQILVSVQKPLGIVLEQDDNDDGLGPVIVAQVDSFGSAGRAGIQPGDVLVAVQNADCSNVSIETVFSYIAKAPAVVNLRFVRTQ